MPLLVVVTYVVSVSVTEARAASVVLAVQLATVWLILRTSHARRVVRRVAGVVLVLAAVAVVVSLFAHNPGDQLGGIFTVCCVLYLIAPSSIVRHLMMRRAIDTETLLGAVAAYLLIGMFFAFAHKAAGEFGSVPFFGPAGERLAQPGPLLWSADRAWRAERLVSRLGRGTGGPPVLAACGGRGQLVHGLVGCFPPCSHTAPAATLHDDPGRPGAGILLSG